MKFLVATVGNKLDSLVAKRFEHAAWYLIVDSDMHMLDSIHHSTPRDRHTVFQKAASEGVEAVVAGKFGESSMKMIRTQNMRVAPVHGILASHALDMIQSHEVLLENADKIENGKGMMIGTVQPIPKMKGHKALASTGYSSDSERGHHHLQQYGGRGH